ncbi:hypothetical protein [Chryseobacterium gleum]|uniref:hypothetical protein n=1 Tax=Chryseobacterium gleum TaxID=250 RepID=UPI001E3E9F95|nr:hypothetical protein [Chryseobacterium gleum]MCD9616264.1 hypothetical protein [Chryseobacterium gleum]MCE4063523.1 hypothetical protein [Chryseobacterium gleum]
MKNSYMGIRCIFSIVFFFVSVNIFAQSDDVQINVRLYPTQMLAVGGDSEMIDETNEIAQPEINSVTISSPSGFQLGIQQDENEEYNLIKSHHGVIEKKFIINQKIDKIIKQFKDKSTFMMLTLISQ